MNYYGFRATFPPQREPRDVFVKVLRDFSSQTGVFLPRNSYIEQIFVFSQLVEFTEKLFIEKIES